MKRIIITGATSMLGVALIEECVAHGIEVVALVRRNSSKTTVLPSSPFVTVIEADLNDLKSIAYEKWPEYDKEKVADDTFELPVQFNGKLKTTIKVKKDLSKDEIEKIVHDDEKIKILLVDKTIIKEIYVPNKIYNIVVK